MSEEVNCSAIHRVSPRSFPAEENSLLSSSLGGNRREAFIEQGRKEGGKRRWLLWRREGRRGKGGKCDRFWSPSKEIKLYSQKTSKGWYRATLKGLSYVARNEPESCVSGLIRSTCTMYMTLAEVQQILRMTRIIYDFQTVQLVLRRDQVTL